MTVAGCFVCRKHRGEVALAGVPIVADDLLVASHRWETPGGIPDEVHARERH